MNITFTDKVALVTGASNGIGRDIAIQLAKCGAKVIAIGRCAESLASLKKEIPTCETIQLDISNWSKTKEILKNIGPIDLLVNNAGQVQRKTLLQTSQDDLNRILDVNFKATFNITQLVIDNLIKCNKPGSIVNVSSLCGLIGVLDHSAYCASKGAMDAFTRAIAVEYGPKNIRINSVNPTVILTDMGNEFCKDNGKFKRMIEETPLRRLGRTREVTDAVLFLLSDKASLITGIALPIDGGHLIC